MELNFDKEIDALLRQAAQGGDFLNENSPAHVDADEISAFAENALPQTAKMRVTGHLADCAKCRNILVNVISLNAETAGTIPANETIEAVIPWYKRLFAFPQIAYAMGALALVFSGVIGILVYQSAQQTASFDMAKVPGSQPAGRGPNAEEEMPIYQDNLANMSNTAMTTNANAAPAPQISSANTSSNFGITESRTFNANATATNTARTDIPKRELSRDNQLMFAPPPPKPEKPAEAEVSAQLADESKEERRTAAEKRTENDVALQKAPAPGSVAGKSAADESPKAKTLSRETETRRISGKTFNRKDGVWYDAAYRQQSTTNVRRNTEDYRKLESGLRVIAESLDGIVVVVWKEKAYRIQ